MGEQLSGPQGEESQEGDAKDVSLKSIGGRRQQVGRVPLAQQRRFSGRWASSVAPSRRGLHDLVYHSLDETELGCRCGRTFLERTLFDNHYAFHVMGKRFFCGRGNCRASFRYGSQFSRHIMKCAAAGGRGVTVPTTDRHNVVAVVVVRCVDCGEQFDSPHQLLAHAKTSHGAEFVVIQ